MLICVVRMEYEFLGSSASLAGASSLSGTAQRYLSQACMLEPRASLAFHERAALEWAICPRVSALPVVVHFYLRAILSPALASLSLPQLDPSLDPPHDPRVVPSTPHVTLVHAVFPDTLFNTLRRVLALNSSRYRAITGDGSLYFLFISLIPYIH